MTLREYITAYCNSHGLSQRQFAAQCDLTNGYISMLMSGVNPKTGKPIRPSIDTFMKLAKGMGISLNVLFQEIDDMPVSLTVQDDDDIWYELESIRRDPERRKLFSHAAHSTIDEIREANAILEALKNTRRN